MITRTIVSRTSGVRVKYEDVKPKVFLKWAKEAARIVPEYQLGAASKINSFSCALTSSVETKTNSTNSAINSLTNQPKTQNTTGNT